MASPVPFSVGLFRPGVCPALRASAEEQIHGTGIRNRRSRYQLPSDQVTMAAPGPSSPPLQHYGCGSRGCHGDVDSIFDGIADAPVQAVEPQSDSVAEAAILEEVTSRYVPPFIWEERVGCLRERVKS